MNFTILMITGVFRVSAFFARFLCPPCFAFDCVAECPNGIAAGSLDDYGREARLSAVLHGSEKTRFIPAVEMIANPNNY